MKNCPNCGAPLDPYAVHCAYCGTYYFDLSAFDCSKKCFVKFKTFIGGQECYVTALARPSLEEAEVKCDTADCCDYKGNVLRRVVTNKYCNLKANFACEMNPEDKSLFRVEAKE